MKDGNPTIKILQTLFERDLNKLIKEINAYKNQQNLWLAEKQVNNSAGNLCLHLIGNLNAFIGNQLGNSGYERKRTLEFSLKDVPVKELTEQIENTKTEVLKALNKLTEQDLAKPFPIPVFGEGMTTHFFLIHLVSHLTYHLGQISYHRRFVEE